MAINQLNKYVWLVETIHRAKKRGGITLKEIQSRWLDSDLRRALKKVPNFKLHSLFLNFNSCPRSISSFKSEILFWTGI